MHEIYQRFVKEIKSLRRDIRYFRHDMKRAKVKRDLKRLRNISDILIHEFRRKLLQECLFECCQKNFLSYEQQSKETNKIKNVFGRPYQSADGSLLLGFEIMPAGHFLFGK